MTLNDEILMAYADGELSGEQMREIERELASRPDLQRFVEQQRALREAVHSSFAEVADQKVPAQLLHAIAQTPVSPRWSLWRACREAARIVLSRRFVLWSGLPAAAALACGLVLGIVFSPSDVFHLERDTGGLIAQGPLAAALNDRLASNQPAENSVHVGISFKSKDSLYCRTFEQSGSTNAVAGVACRAPNGWSVAALARTTPERSGSAYRTAESAMPDLVRRAVSGMIEGEPLDAAAERRARDAGWRIR